jgi:site-specific DNA-methyltransferase (adenine-specific)
MNELFLGNNLDIIKEFPDNVIDAVVTDPPYGINFLNKKWDYDVPTVEFWEELYRVLKPGGHILVFCGTRTQHRMVVNIEDAGFEIRDILTWLYGEGMPHGYDIAKGIEGIVKKGNANTTEFKELKGDDKKKSLGYSRMAFEEGARPDHYCAEGTFKTNIEFETNEANYWSGWNTALKPACEFITLARKPISEKNIPLNVLKWGTGGINIDATRIELNGEIVPINKLEKWSGFGQEVRPDYKQEKNEKGRWPANLLLDEVSAELLDEQTGELKSGYAGKNSRAWGVANETSINSWKPKNTVGYRDFGGASRFFYQAKAKKKDKFIYCRDCEDVYPANDIDEHIHDHYKKNGKPDWSHIVKHPTVKPIKLIEYLVKLVTPKNGICIDPYMGSGTTGVACRENGYKFIGIEKDEEYFKIAMRHIREE